MDDKEKNINNEANAQTLANESFKGKNDTSGLVSKNPIVGKEPYEKPTETKTEPKNESQTEPTAEQPHKKVSEMVSDAKGGNGSGASEKLRGNSGNEGNGGSGSSSGSGGSAGKGDSQDFEYEKFYNAYKAVEGLNDSFNRTVPNLGISSDGLSGLDVSNIDNCNPCLKTSCGVNNNISSLVSTFNAINQVVISSDASAREYFLNHEAKDFNIENFAEEMANQLGEQFNLNEQEKGELKESIKNEYHENIKNGFILFYEDIHHTLDELKDSKIASSLGFETEDQMYNAMLALVISESNKTPDEVAAITTVVMNRCDRYENWANGKDSANPFDQLFAPKSDGSVEFEAFTRDGGRYKDYIPELRENGVDSVNDDLENIGAGYSYEELKQAFDDVYFGGLRNNVYSCYGSGWTDYNSIRPTVGEYGNPGGDNGFYNNTDDVLESEQLYHEAMRLGIKTWQLEEDKLEAMKNV